MAGSSKIIFSGEFIVDDRSPIKVGVMDSGYPPSSIIPFPQYDFESYLGEAKSFIHGESEWDMYGHGRLIIGSFLDELNDDVKVEFYSAKILNNGGSGSVHELTRAEQWLVSKNVDIVFIAMGAFPRLEYTMEGIFEHFEAANILVVNSVGNSGGYADVPHATTTFPANALRSNIISVGAYISNVDPITRTYYSSIGRNYEGLNVLDVVDNPFAIEFDGKMDGNEGTSFSAPKVAAKIVNAMFALPDIHPIHQHKIGLDDINWKNLAIYSAYLSTNEYDRHIGFGVVDDEVMIENYFTEFFFTDYNMDQDDVTYVRGQCQEKKVRYYADSFEYTRIESNIFSNVFTEDHNWYFIFQSCPQSFPMLTYDIIPMKWDAYEITRNESILIDHSGLNDLLLHRYGVMMETMQTLMRKGFNVTISDRDISDLNLSQFDAIFSPDFEDRWYDGYDAAIEQANNPYAEDIKYYHSNESLKNLLEYTENGGNWIISNRIFEGFEGKKYIRLQKLYDEFNITFALLNYKYNTGFSKGTDLFGNFSSSIYYEPTAGSFEISGGIPLFKTDANEVTGIIESYFNGTVIILGDNNPFVFDTDRVFLYDLVDWLL